MHVPISWGEQDTPAWRGIDALSAVIEAHQDDVFRRGIQMRDAYKNGVDLAFAESALFNLRAQVGTAAKEIIQNPHYRNVGFEDLDSGKIRHVAGFIPLDPFAPVVWLKFGEIAEGLYEKIKPDEGLHENSALIKKRIQTLLMLNASLSTRELNKQEFLRINGTSVSPEFVYKQWKEVTIKYPDDAAKASLELCRALGIKGQKRKLTRDLQVHKSKAWDFLSKILDRTQSIVENEFDEESVVIESLDPDDSLQALELTELLGVMYDTSAEDRSRIEAQSLAVFMLELFNIRNSEVYQGSGSLKTTVARQVETCFDPSGSKKVYFNRLFFNKDGSIEKVVPMGMDKKARKIKLSKPHAYSGLVLFEGVDDKSAESNLTKLISRYYDKDVEEIYDQLRWRLVIPDMTTLDLVEDEDKYQYAKQILLDQGAALNLRHNHTAKKAEDLKVGEFMIDDSLNEKDELYRNMKLIGIIPDSNDPTGVGTNVEVQLNTIDLYEIEHGKNSPLSHDDFAELREITQNQNVLPVSHFEQGHEAMKRKKKKLTSRRENAITSGLQYVRTGRRDFASVVAPIEPSPPPEAEPLA